ncbi:MAG: hypothetical protein ACRDT2_00365 [Natronosporangium sp.]
MPQTRVFDIQFTASFHDEAGRRIAKAARVQLRPTEIDNEWKDTVGRGTVGNVRISISRTGTPDTWLLLAHTPDEVYDRDAMARLREDVLAALRDHAQEYREYPSQLYQPNEG